VEDKLQMAKKTRSKIIVYAAVVLALILVLNIILGSLGEKRAINEIQEKQEKQEESFIRAENATLVSLQLPAVDAEGRGVSTRLNVEAIRNGEGKGRTLVDIENLLFWADTQQSIRMARLVAGNYAGNNISDYNLIYNIEANASVIGGPSAGAAITIATIFALRGEKPRHDVMITGNINHDGSIGPVDGILEKAKASKEIGASILLVPLLQSRDVVYETKENCEKFGLSEICQTESIPRKINVSNEANITVIEVANISEALSYFS